MPQMELTIASTRVRTAANVSALTAGMAAHHPAHLADQARRVYSYFAFRLRQPEEAERLTRLTFERARRAAAGDDADRDPDQRLFAAARAVIATHPRRRGASRVAPPDDRAKGGEDGPTALSNELVLAIGRLHGRERDALALRFGAELGVAEIAELLDRTPADVKQRLARGVRTLSELGVLPKQRRPAGGLSAERSGAGGAEGGKGKQRKASQERGGDAKP
jgi:DNA-directed RNA polymerase specialized sigma24 family protein